MSSSQGVGPIQVVVDSAPPARTQSTDASFTFRAEGHPGAMFQCQVDTGTPQPCTGGSFVVRNVLPGDHVFTGSASDGAATGTAQATWTVDQTPPTVMLSGAPTGTVNQPTISVSFTVTSPQGDATTVACTVDGARHPATGPCVSPIMLNQSAQDHVAHTLTVTATDFAGNAATAMAAWTQNNVLANVILDSFPSALSGNGNATFTFSTPSTDPTNAFRCALDGGAATACTSPFVRSGLADGAHTFSVQVVDGAMNAGAAATRMWTVDTSPPVLTVDSAPGAGPQGSNVAIAFSATDLSAVTYTCALDTGSALPCTSPRQVTAGAGMHTLRVVATDALGRSSAPTTVMWTVVRQWASVAAGTDRSCATTNFNELYCWGLADVNGFQLGSSMSGLEGSPLILADSQVARVVMGPDHGFALHPDGSAHAWGDNTQGEAGVGMVGGVAFSSVVGGGEAWAQLSAGPEHSCGVRPNGTLWCWGSAANGRLGLGATAVSSAVPMQVGTEMDWQRVAAGGRHTCALKTGGELYC
jgi:hypothetical protein